MKAACYVHEGAGQRDCTDCQKASRLAELEAKVIKLEADVKHVKDQLAQAERECQRLKSQLARG